MMDYQVVPAHIFTREPNGKWYFEHNSNTKEYIAVSPEGKTFVIYPHDAAHPKLFRLLEAMAVTITRGGL